MLVLKAALDEICSGIEVFEFSTRIGASRQEAKGLLKELGVLLGDMRTISESARQERRMISLDELAECFRILCSHAKSRGVTAVEPGNDDLYWSVGSPDWRKIHQDPAPGVGSFADDASELKKLLADPGRASAVDLDRLASMLRVISDSVAF